jgi:predicted small lipoprotein YifL
MKKIIFTVILASFLIACGQTGKLVLPTKTEVINQH